MLDTPSHNEEKSLYTPGRGKKAETPVTPVIRKREKSKYEVKPATLGEDLTRANKAIDEAKTQRALEATRKALKGFEDRTTRKKVAPYLERFDERTAKILAEKEKIEQSSSEPSQETMDALAEIKQISAEKLRAETMKPAKFEDLKVGQKVVVKRSNGELDGGWVVLIKAADTKMARVTKIINGKDRYKILAAEDIFVPASKGKKQYNQNVISRDLYKITKEIDSKAAAESSTVVLKEGNKSAWLRLEKKRGAYVAAYKKFHKNLDKESTDEEIAEMNPPRFRFLNEDRQELGRLFDVYVEEKNNEKSRELRQDYEDSLAKQARENLTKHGRVMFKDTEPGLSPEAIKDAKESEELDELVASLKGEKAAAEVDKFLGQKEGYNLGRDIVRPDRVRYDLLEAYKDMGVLVGEGAGGNVKELLSKKPPFSYIFSARGRKVRDLYDQYVKKLEEEK